jgi:conjugative transposon TraJ protein
MLPLAINFENLHQILRNLYAEMLPLCGDMIGVAKGVAGLGALFYVAYRVWKSLASAEPIDVFPLLRPFAIGLCIMFFPTVVLGTINSVMSPVVQGTHGILESQTTNVEALQQQRDDLEYDARVREGKEWLVDDEAYDEQLSELGIRQVGKIVSMWWERSMYGIKQWFRELIQDFFELLFNAAALTIDTLRTFFLVVLAILGPLSFALSIYDGFQSTLTNWLSRYISVYLWLPCADIFSAVLSKIRALMLEQDIALLQDPAYSPDGANGVYIIFLVIGIIGYFSIPTVAEWIIQSGGGAGSAMGGINRASVITAGLAGAAVGNVAGKVSRGAGSAIGSGFRSLVGGRRGGGGGDGSPNGQNMATQGGGGSGVGT